MLKRSLFACILLSICWMPSTSAQVKAGEQAPELHITNWVQNAPAQKSLKGKFLVLDFWATWCAPCLAAVPHLNDIAEAYKKDNRLVFLSMSDERESKIRTLLPKVPFSTAVVSDSTGRTQRQFKITSIPFCVLIDDKMQVQWAGHAAMLTDSMVQHFLQRKPIPAPPGEKLNTATASVKQLYDSLGKTYRTVMDDKDITEYFSLGGLLDNASGMRWNRISPEVLNEAVLGRGMQGELADKLGVSARQVVLPPAMTNSNISYCYKSTFRPKPKDLVETIARALDLEVNQLDSLQEVITLEVTDTSRLYAELSDLPQGTSRISTSDDGKFLSLHNNTLKALGDAVQGFYNTPVVITGAELLARKFNMTVKTGSFEEFLASMHTYGIKAAKNKARLQVYHFQYKSGKDKKG